MTLADFKEVLEKTEMPVAYLQFSEDDCPPLPIIVYQELNTNNFSADDIAYAKFKVVQVDLLTENKDPESESLLEEALDNAGIYYDAEDDFNESELCYRRTYTMEI